MTIIGYHGTKTDFETFETDTRSLDRMVGPHFSKTPELANRFALRNPGRKGNGKRTGGRVIPVKLAGAVYTVNQHFADFPGFYSRLTHPEKGYWLGLFAADYHAIAHDIGKVVLNERSDLLARYARVAGFADASACLASFEASRHWQLVSNLELEADNGLKADLARAYRDILVARGFGVLEYVNTAKKEQVGDLADQTCYIALNTPRFYFD
ncbi:hypothetical protein WJ97_12675 [Burkholderia ubonensis]|uniref:hypothetical protein n=1 Tax=Burkholderia ubonensis TaxID=101571 RepID=UPI00075C759D|nr:hypothetical protein [Burkholderia ubonensis]KVP96728.1 hypothetical protein WJ97_12675 [Burkholderia ubonensis]